jgi:anti-sigma regulatory factor (Ser/Thr protein kinase)
MAHQLHQQYQAADTTPALARRHLTGYLVDRLRPELISAATLLVSELVTNAVVYAGGTLELRAWFVGPVLHVEVADTSRVLPQRRQPADGGRGLHIVDALADSWGVNIVDGHGKTTWFQLQQAP